MPTPMSVSRVRLALLSGGLVVLLLSGIVIWRDWQMPWGGATTARKDVILRLAQHAKDFDDIRRDEIQVKVVTLSVF